MKISNKISIFGTLQLHPTQRCSNQRHLERPCIGINLLRWKLGLVSLQGLFICLCFQSMISEKYYSVFGINVCNRYTLSHKAFGSGKSCRHRQGGTSIGLFAGAFSLLLLCLFCSLTSFIPFFVFSFKIIQL